MSIVEIGGMVLGLVSVASQAGIPSKFKPALAVILGVGIALLSLGVTKDSVILGIMAGLSSSGLWAGTKAMIKEEPLIEDRG